MSDGRRAIVLGTTLASWRWSRGYVENVAAAVALAAEDGRAAGRVYNVAAPRALTEAEWVATLGRIAGWDGEVVVIPDDVLPERLQDRFDFTQHLDVDTCRIRSELGYREPVGEGEGLSRTIDRELATIDDVPSHRLDYDAEDAALQLLE